MLIAAAILAVACPQARPAKSLEDYLKAVPADARAALTQAVDEKAKAAQAVKDPENDLLGLGLQLDGVVKRHPWIHRWPVLTAALKGRQGHTASVILHVMAMRALTDGIFREGELDDFRALNRLAVEAVAPYVADKEASARLQAVNFLKTVADTQTTDKVDRTVSLHAPPTLAVLRNALTTASKDANERIARWGKEGLQSLDNVGK